MAQIHKNEVHLAGELAKDPGSRYTQTGKKICTLTVVTKHKQWSEFHRVVCWEADADKAEKLAKGEFVQIVGRLQTRSWEDKETGQKKYSTEVVAFQLVVPDQEPPPLTPDANKGTEIARAILRPAKGSIVDDDIPF